MTINARRLNLTIPQLKLGVFHAVSLTVAGIPTFDATSQLTSTISYIPRNRRRIEVHPTSQYPSAIPSLRGSEAPINVPLAGSIIIACPPPIDAPACEAR